MRWSYVFWDWNGTIVDDLYYNYKIVNKFLFERHLLPISIEEYRNHFCFPIKTFYERIGLDYNEIEYSKIAVNYQKIYESRMHEIKIANKVLYLMELLHDRNIKQILFTSCNRNTLTLQLNLYSELRPYIDGIICQNNNLGEGKYDLALKWKNNNPSVDWNKVVIIGDTYYEYEIAKKLGTCCILINSGHQLIEKEGSYIVFDSIEDLSNNLAVFFTNK